MSLSTDGSASSSDGVYASTSLRGIDVPFDMAMPHEYEALAHRLRDGGVDGLVRAAEQSTARNSHTAASVKSCANLAVAGAGSSTLSLLVTSLGTPLVHHRHEDVPLKLYRAGARCFITTLRDPATRLGTAFTFEMVMHWPPSGSVRISDINKPLWHSKHATEPEVWMQNFRNVWHQPHTHNFTFEARYAYNHSLPGNQRARVGSHTLRGPGSAMGHGNPFLAPQVTYYADLVQKTDGRLYVGNHSSPVDLHFVCLNRFQEDWTRILEAYSGQPPSGSSSTIKSVSTGARSIARASAAASAWIWNVSKTNHHGKPKWFKQPLSNASVDYLRRCMYPYDWMLYSRVCLGEEVKEPPGCRDEKEFARFRGDELRAIAARAKYFPPRPAATVHKH